MNEIEDRAEAAGGATSQAFNAALIERAIAACVPPGDPNAQAKAKAITDALADIGPQNAVEAMLASLLVAPSITAPWTRSPTPARRSWTARPA